MLLADEASLPILFGLSERSTKALDRRSSSSVLRMSTRAPTPRRAAFRFAWTILPRPGKVSLRTGFLVVAGRSTSTASDVVSAAAAAAVAAVAAAVAAVAAAASSSVSHALTCAAIVAWLC